MDSFRYPVRSLTRARGFVSATVATLAPAALAVRAGSTVFGLVNAILLRPLTFANADRLVGIWHTLPGINLPLAKQSSGTYALYRESAQSFEAMGVYLALSATLTYRDATLPPERAHVGYMTASMFSTLGA